MSANIRRRKEQGLPLKGEVAEVVTEEAPKKKKKAAPKKESVPSE